MNNSDGKASLKRQKSLETTTDTGCEQVLLISRVKCSYLEIFIVVNRPNFVPHTIPFLITYSNFHQFPRYLTPSHTTRSWTDLLKFFRVKSLVIIINRWLFLETWAWAACGLSVNYIYLRSVIFWYNLRQVWRLNKSVKVSISRCTLFKWSWPRLIANARHSRCPLS